MKYVRRTHNLILIPCSFWLSLSSALLLAIPSLSLLFAPAANSGAQDIRQQMARTAASFPTFILVILINSTVNRRRGHQRAPNVDLFTEPPPTQSAYPVWSTSANRPYNAGHSPGVLHATTQDGLESAVHAACPLLACPTSAH